MQAKFVDTFDANGPETNTVTLIPSEDLNPDDLAIIAIGRGANIVLISISVGTNLWTIRSMAHTSGTLNVSLAYCFITELIPAGTPIVCVFSGNSSRAASVLACISNDNVQYPLETADAPILSSAAQAILNTTTPLASSTGRAMVIMAVAVTGNGYPVTHKVNRKIGERLSGLANPRGVALFLKSEGGHPHNSQATLNASTISVSATTAIACKGLEPDELAVLTEFGEEVGVLTYWDGTSEWPVNSMEQT